MALVRDRSRTMAIIAATLSASTILSHIRMADQPVEDAMLICRKRVWEKSIQLIETFSDTRIGLLRAARRTPAMDEKIMEDERKQLRGEKWCRFLRGACLFQARIKF